jgi:hypothetical protein
MEKELPRWSVGYPVALVMAWICGIVYFGACHLEERERRLRGEPTIEEELDASLNGIKVIDPDTEVQASDNSSVDKKEESLVKERQFP